jgi:hypothetical protein
MNPLEILQHLDTFYNNAWNKLILYTTILLAVVGILIPLLISWLQARSLKLKEENLLELLKAENLKNIDTLKKELFEEVEEEFKKTKRVISSRLMELRAELKGLHFHLQANTAQNTPVEKLIDYIIASNYYIECKDYQNLNTTIGCICDELCKVSKTELKEIEEEHTGIESLVSELAQINENGAFSKQIRDLRRIIRQLED